MGISLIRSKVPHMEVNSL